MKQFDYHTNARYFITICTFQKKHTLSKVTVGRGLAPAETHLTDVGEIVEAELRQLNQRYPYLMIENYVIMPNHIHIIMTLNYPAGASPRPTIIDIICAYKSLCTRRCRQSGLTDALWQTSLYDHVIRNEEDYRSVWEYIDANPARWTEDEYYI